MTEGQTTLLIYCSFGLIGLGMNAWYLLWKRKKDRDYYKRKAHILDQASLRLREMGLIIEDIWQQNHKEKK